MTTRTEEISETKRQILTKAEQLFAQRGFDGVSMREIAEACDITKAIFRMMASEGIKLDSGLFDTLLSAYVRKAEDTLRYYSAAPGYFRDLTSRCPGFRRLPYYPKSSSRAAPESFERLVRRNYKRGCWQ